MSRSAWLTLGDVRLAALRVVAAGGLLVLLQLVRTGPAARVLGMLVPGPAEAGADAP